MAESRQRNGGDENPDLLGEEGRPATPGTNEGGDTSRFSKKCNGKCDIRGFITYHCNTCGWDDEWVPASDPYL